MRPSILQSIDEHSDRLLVQLLRRIAFPTLDVVEELSQVTEDVLARWLRAEEWPGVAEVFFGQVPI